MEREHIPWDIALNPLWAALDDLFPTRADAELQFDEAGIPNHRIAFRETAEVMRHAVLTEVRKQDRLSQLLRVAQARYPENRGLALAAVGFGVGAVGSADVLDLAIVTAMGEEVDPVLELIGGPDRWAKVAADGFVRYQATCPPAAAGCATLPSPDVCTAAG